MKKIIITFIAAFLFNSCQMPFKIEIANGSLSKNADGSVSLGYHYNRPSIIEEK